MRNGRLYLLLMIGVGLAFPAAAQQKEKRFTDAPEEDHVFTKVELGVSTNTQAWGTYIQANTVLPDSVAKKIPAGVYKVLISFIVNVDGRLQDVKADNDPGYGLASRALTIFNGYKGKWQPASQCGRMVKSYEKRPIVFVVGP